jgi:hypothetical protein
MIVSGSVVVLLLVSDITLVAVRASIVKWLARGGRRGGAGSDGVSLLDDPAVSLAGCDLFGIFGGTVPPMLCAWVRKWCTFNFEPLCCESGTSSSSKDWLK